MIRLYLPALSGEASRTATLKKVAGLLLMCALTGCAAGTSTGPESATPSSPGQTSKPNGSASPSGTPTPQVTALPSGAPSSTPTVAPQSINACGSAPVAEGTVPFPPAPDSDTFYAQPASFGSAARGTVLASRMITYTPDGAPMTNPAWQIKFVSCDTQNQPIAAIATIVKPLAGSASPQPLFVEEIAEDSLGLKCAPSHSATGSTADSNANTELGEANNALAAGWSVLLPDFEGPLSEFEAGKLSGQITLDGIRAAESFTPAGLTANTPVGLNGYSGGAFAAAWAASLQHTYAPQLNIVAFAVGGTPAKAALIDSNIDQNPVANAAFYDIVFAGALGENRAFPQYISPILNAKGIMTATNMENGCVGDNSDGSPGASGNDSDFETVNNPQSTPGFIAVSAVDDLAQPQTPLAPGFVYASQTDELIPIADSDEMTSEWCSQGAKINYYRAVSGDHIATEATVQPIVNAYFVAIFNGTAPVYPPTTMSCN